MLCELGRTKTGSAKIERIQSANSHKTFKQFLANTAGNTSMVFMMTLLPCAGFVGMMTDYGRSFVVKQEITTALDAAALVGGRTFDQTGNMAQSAQAAKVYFSKSLPRYIKASLSSVKTDAKGNVTMSAGANMKPMFLPLVGINNIEIKSSVKSLAADSSSGNGNLAGKNVEVALVMDVTGSMGQNNKLINAKTAAKDLINILLPASGVGARSVRISVVPFSQYVNIGPFVNAATGNVPTQPVVTNGTPVTKTVCNYTTPGTTCVSKAGYDPVTGLNPAGYDKNGHDTNGRDHEGCDKHGVGDDGFDANGYDKHGYDKYGHYQGDNGSDDNHGQDHHEHDHHDHDHGFGDDHDSDNHSHNQDGSYCKEGSSDSDQSDTRDANLVHYSHHAGDHDSRGYDQHGFDADGFDNSGADDDGHGHSGKDREGYDHDGYKLANDNKLRDREGYDKDGYELDSQGVDRDRDGYDRAGYKFDVASNNNDDDHHGQCGRSSSSSTDYDKNGCDRNGKDRWGVTSVSGITPKSAGITCAKYTTNNNLQPCQTTTVVPQVTTQTSILPCMIERPAATGHAYDDANPSTAAFPALSSTVPTTTCPPAVTVTPLSNDPKVLNAAIDSLAAGGGTAGHIGTAWGWYTLSPKWSAFWPAGSSPAAASPSVVKIAIIMTDGGFNWHYDSANNAVNDDSTTNSSTLGNGLSRNQASTVCTNMKNAGIEIFTVGVEVSSASGLASDAAALQVLQNCGAPLPGDTMFSQHYYSVSNNNDPTAGLDATFKSIATQIAVATGTGNQRLRMTQ